MGTGTDLEVSTPAELEQLLFEGPGEEIDQDPVQVQREILQRIFAATSPEELRQVSNATPWQELLTLPVEVHDIRLRRSNFDQGAAVFAVVDAVDMRDGKMVTLTCSGMNVLATLLQHKRMGWLPWRWRLAQSDRPTASGYNVLRLDDEGLGNILPATARAEGGSA